MVDFFKVRAENKKGVIRVYPKFIIKNPCEDLMIRGRDFYAVWLEEKHLWSTNEQDVIDLIDAELTRYVNEHFKNYDGQVNISYMWDAESGMVDAWHRYCQKQMRDNFHMLDETIIFANHEAKKEDYASKRLAYPLQEGDISAYDKLVGTLYSPKERHKIEWCIGSIVCGDSKTLQKFAVLYGDPGTGKGTILDIIEKLFKGYIAFFDAKSVGNSSSSFALESFSTNPLVAIQHDGNLSRIEDNTRLNSLVSHESLVVNEKYKSTYSNSFKAFLFLGSNNPVKITDSKSGLLRRLIDISPSGNTVPKKEYDRLKKQINFELGAIAYHCLQVYKEDPDYYDKYRPISMLGASNDFYNFMLENYYIFEKDDYTTLADAWMMYGQYCIDANVGYKLQRIIFKEELKTYFESFEERHTTTDGKRVRNYYSGLISDKFENFAVKLEPSVHKTWIELKEQPSIFDEQFKDCPAQLAVKTEGGNDKPRVSWANCKTTLEAINTKDLHYVKCPITLVTVDFDIPDENGNKSLEKNIEAASSWPPTYCEVSKSGQALHLEYIYTGDNPEDLCREVEPHIEVKVNVGNSSLRRKLTLCNDLPIAEINTGLKKVEKKRTMINEDIVRTERGLITTIKKCLRKEVPPGATVTNVDFIKKILDEYYESGEPYDVSAYEQKIWSFAANSTHNKQKCLDMVKSMHFKSETVPDNIGDPEGDIIFFDVEVFPNLLLINWKRRGKDKPCKHMINPSPSDVAELVHMGKLVGFNCRRYDNHILYARILGMSIEDIYKISKAIIGKDKDCFFPNAYDLSYTDIFDFSSKKQSLKKFEIELGITHKELSFDWDKPVPEELWDEISAYCDNDVIATEATFEARQADFLARQILADLAGMTVNDTTNSLTTRIIFGNNKKPQNEFCYRDLSKPIKDNPNEQMLDFLCKAGKPIWFTGKGESYLPFFPGYKFELSKSTYRGEEIGEGGYVYSEPGMYGNVALLDIASMHPSSIVNECLFGPRYTAIFNDILQARIYIKHKEYDKAGELFGGKLKPYLTDDSSAKGLSQALKIAINSVYGLTDAGFANPFRDPRNKDNIVAKRGALFMVDLKHAVQEQGFTVAHIKTDSIKIPDATPEIIQFVMDFGKKYGYNFEHEATYDRMCLVNDAVYIAKYKDGEHAGEWTATGTQFQIPYVFKSLFSKEEITFNDMCETKSVTSALYLDMNEPKIMRLYETYRDEYDKDLGENIVKFNSLETYLNIDEAMIDMAKLEKVLKKLKYEYNEADLHDYKFIGKIGRFCPIKVGENGGLLVREKDGKYSAATGSKGYRWVESWVLESSGEYDKIDKSYYDNLVTEAAKDISIYGDLEWFISDDPYVGPEMINGKPSYLDEIPWKVG